MRWIRRAPVTTETLIICVALFFGCTFQSIADHKPFGVVQRDWGAIQLRHHLEIHDGVRRVKDCELNGPFDVWDGEWWRIPLTAFHHVDLPHLLLVMVSAVYLGRLLEQEWGSLSFGLFLIPATTIPIISELFSGNAVMGFDGAVFAMLGALCVLKISDANPPTDNSFDIFAVGFAAIVIFAMTTAAGLIPFAMIARVTGFSYGTVIAALFGLRVAKSPMFRITVVLTHLWLVPALFLVSHPYWIGRYHWYRASSIRSPKFAEKSLERAITCDPTLAGVWLRWSEIAEENADDLQAWNRLVRGLVINPSNAALMDSIRRRWRHFDSRQHKEAEQILEASFGRQFPIWLNSIRASGPTPLPYPLTEDTKSTETSDLSELALDQAIELPSTNLQPHPSLKPRDVEEVKDASEGQPL